MISRKARLHPVVSAISANFAHRSNRMMDDMINLCSQIKTAIGVLHSTQIDDETT